MKTFSRIVAALISGALLAQAYGLHPIWPLAWIAPAPLLLAVFGAPRATAFGLGALAGALSVGGMFAYLLSLSGPAPLAIVILLKSIAWGAMALAARASAARLPNWAAALVLPALMAAIETLIAQISPHGSVGSLAYSQMDFLPVIQAAALGGAPAVTFLLALAGAAASLAIWKRNPAPAIVPGLIVAAALAWGWLRVPDRVPPESRDVRVAMLASDAFAGIPDDWRSIWAGYAPQIERAADGDYRVVLLPEKIAFLSAVDRDAAVAAFGEIAHQRDIVVVVSFDVDTGAGRFNRAYVFRPDAETLTYDKRRMVPGLESYFTRGASALTFERGASRFGVAICKDMDFPDVGRSYPGARVLLVPAWDFGVDAWLHSRMAMLRGVENGYTILRSARDGLLTVSDRYGRVIRQASSGPRAELYAEAPLGAPGPTLYERIGDAFGWACWVLSALLLGWPAPSRKREGEGGANAD